MKHYLYPFLQKLFAIWLGCMALPMAIWAQAPTNDDCEGAIALPSVANYCSAVGEFTNVNATASSYGAPGCFGIVGRDVWFSFVATATDVSIVIKGEGLGGTMNAPAVALYAGTCGGIINELECDVDNNGIHLVEIYQGGLVVGATYFLRIQGLNNQTGTFQVCVNNYNPPVEPQGDCPTGSILCDKSPFVVQAVSGAGTDIDELDQAPCFIFGSQNPETNSTWFKWVADNTGSLTFNITPLNPNDDIDFVIFELPNGLNDCSGKIVRLCMASGPYNPECPTYPISNCSGATGLRNASVDVNENPNCCPGQDNFLAPLQMVEGRAYALAINNFTSTGNGFSMDFGGTGNFRGPNADFSIAQDSICVDEQLIVTDNSSYQFGNIVAWEWAFGLNSTPFTANVQGPHSVTYTNSGNKSIVLTVESNEGCRVTHVENVYIRGILDVDTLSTQPSCFGDTDGNIQLNVKPYCATPPFTFNWGAGTTPANTLSNLTAGTYPVTITDADGRTRVYNIRLGQPALLVSPIDTLNISCFGQADGRAVVNPTGGTPDYIYQWSDGSVGRTNSNLTQGNYTVTVTDMNGCSTTNGVFITEPIELTGVVLDSTDVLCFGDSTGTVTLQGIVGSPPYTYSADGITYQPDTVLRGLAAGTYDVYIRDSRGCLDTLMATINQPQQLVAFAAKDTTIQLGYTTRLEASHTPPASVVTYNWSSPQTLSCPTCDITTAKPFETTTYVVTITDQNNCTATDRVIIKIDKERPIYIPTGFSPNNDGFNDFFTLYAGPAVEEIEEMKVFDRWGELLFETSNIKPNIDRAGWDGSFRDKPLNPAVFVYYFKVRFIDQEVVIYKGGITLVK